MTKQEQRDEIASLINVNTLNAKVAVHAMRGELLDYVQQVIDQAGMHDKLKLEYSLCDTEVDQEIERDFNICDVANFFTLDVIASNTECYPITISFSLSITEGTLETGIEINSDAFTLEKKDDDDIYALKLIIALNDSFDSLESFVNSDVFISSLRDLTHQCELYDDLATLNRTIEDENATSILNSIKPGDVIENKMLQLYVTRLTPKRVYVKSELGRCWFYEKQRVAHKILHKNWKLIHK